MLGQESFSGDVMSIKWFGSREWKQRHAEGRSLQETQERDGSTVQIGVRKLITPEIQVKEPEDDDEGNRTLRFIISSNAVDRDGDKIKQSGWLLDNYRKNPVVLWAHDSRTPPVGKASNVEIKGNKKLVADAEFVPADIYPFADMVFRMYQEKFLNATSVGFIPLDVEEAEDLNRGGGGFFMPLDINKQELLEFSAVPVPANPEALVQARKSGIDTRPLTEWAEQELDQWDELKCSVPFEYKHIEAAYKASKTESTRSAGGLYVPIHVDVGEVKWHTPEVAEQGSASRATKTVTIQDQRTEKDNTRVRLNGPISWRRAHPDGTAVAERGDEWSGAQVRRDLPEERDRWLHIFAWFDPNSADEDGDGLPDAKDAWKLPHHAASEDTPVVWTGVVGAMAALMGAGGGLDISKDDRRAIYNHLARHYREDFDEVPPDFEAVEHQLLASEEYVMNMKTGRLAKAQPDTDEEVDETDAALAAAAADDSTKSTEDTGTSDSANAAGADGSDGESEAGAKNYQFTVRIGDAETTCTVGSFEEMKELLDRFAEKRGDPQTATGDADTTDKSTSTSEESVAGEDDTDSAGTEVKEAIQELDLDALIEKYGEEEVLKVLPEVAEGVVDSMLDQMTGRVH